MPDERLLTIAQRLLALTGDAKLRWQPAGKPEDGPASTFMTRLASGSAAITAATPQGRYPYELRLLDTARSEVGRVVTGDDAELWLGDREAEPWEVTLKDLYAAARGSAVDSDAALNAMLAELERR